MRGLVITGALAALLATASPAAAARVCSGESQPGELRGVTVDIRVDNRGRELSRSARWGIEPDGGGTGWPIVGLNYEVAGGSLGALTDVTLLHVVLLEPLPKSSHAEIRVRVDGSGDWSRPWAMYAQMMREYRAGRVNTVAIMGAVPLAFTGDRPENADLIAAIGEGHAIEVSVVGDVATEHLGGGRYALSTGVRDAEFIKALAAAEGAARDWRRCQQEGR